jgi:uncharacterized protein YciI
MSHEALPPGAEIEQVWVLEAAYAPDGAEARAPFRAEHLERIAGLIREGIVLEAGAYMDVSRSIVMLRVESEEAALAIARQDPYVREGVWVELRVAPFGRVVVEPEDAGA